MQRIVGFSPLLVYSARALAACCLLVLIHAQLINQTMAQETTPFDIALDTEYVVQESGITTVTHRFAITNTTPTQYLSEYALQVHYSDLSEITIESEGKTITPELSNSAGSTSIKVIFPDQVVGQGNTRNMTIKYQTSAIATIAGSVLEIQLPQLRGEHRYSQHNIILLTPLRFGRANRVTPEPSSVNLRDQTIETRFQQAGTQAITALFGDRQIFQLGLRYNLENPSSNRGLAQIALPPDTSFQRVYYHSLDPYPQEIKVDQDGNWIASYQLEPHSTITAHLTLSALISLTPNPDVPIIAPLPDHTAAKRYWDSDNARIAELAATHSSIEQSYRYVVDHLQYNYDAASSSSIAPRLGALEALRQPDQAVCQEFTDLFISLARSQGVPARRLTGYAYTQNPTQRPLSFESDTLHAWPEFFDQSLGYWKPVDPTWEHTTGGIDYFSQFDLNHIVFAINGSSSTTPFPAGSYKSQGVSSKDIEVSFSETFPTETANLAVSLDPGTVFGIPVPGRYHVLITNQTGLAWYDQTVVLEASADAEVYPPEIAIPVILPYQVLSIPIQLSTDVVWPLRTSATLTTRIQTIDDQENYTQTSERTAGPAFLGSITEDNLALGLAGILIALTLGTGGVLVFRQRRNRALRRQSQKSQKTPDKLHPSSKTTRTNSPTGSDSNRSTNARS